MPLPSIGEILSEIERSPAVLAARQRGEVDRLRVRDSTAALRKAREIQHPWYRCQALSSVVDANPAMSAGASILDEAMQAAYEQDEPNRIASVAAWPLRTMVRRRIGSPQKHLRRLLSTIDAEPHGLRRLDGQAALLGAVLTEDALRAEVFPAFIKTLAQSRGWRTERIAGTIACGLIRHDPDAARRIVETVPVSRFTREARALLGLG